MDDQEQLAAQYAVARVLAETDSLAAAAPRLLEAMCEHFEWQLGELWLPDSDGLLHIVEGWYIDDEQLAEFHERSRTVTLRVGEGLAGRVWATKAAAWIDDVPTGLPGPRRELAISAGLKSGFAFPVFVRNQVLGVFDFFSRTPTILDAPLLNVTTAIGSQVGQFLERTQAQVAVRASEARKSAILEAAMDCIITMDDQGRIVEFNPAAERTFGYRRDEVVGRRVADVVMPERLREMHLEGLRRYLETGTAEVIGRRIEVTGMRRDGSEFPVELAVTRVEVDGPPLFTGYLRDITEQKRVEAQRDRILALEQETRLRVEEASRRLRALQTITEAALAYVNLQDLAEGFLLRVSEVLQVETVAILLLSEDGSHLAVRAALGVGTPVEGIRIPIGEGLAGRIASTGQPLTGANVPADQMIDPVMGESPRAALGVPLRVEGRVIGVLEVGAPEGRRFEPDDTSLLRLAADRIAIAMERARLFEREHMIAESLQRSLLPARLPSVPGVDVAVRYTAGGLGLEVGGDWYDVLGLADGKVGVAIGDVVGRGLRAAAAMGQLRNIVRAYAFEGHPPREVLEKVNRLTESLDRAEMATVVLLTIDPVEGSCVYANAGHPPPIVMRPDGTVRWLEGGRSVPLGAVADATFTEATEVLVPGSIIFLYTDGLIERREVAIDEGLNRLEAAVSEATGDLEQMCDQILDAMFGEYELDDDAELLALRLVPVGGRPLRLDLPAVPQSVASVRTHLGRYLTRAGVPTEDVFEITVATCEASANAVEHAYGPSDARFVVEASADDDIVDVVVRDFGNWRPSRSVDRGRGIGLMESLMDDVTITPSPAGTEVRMTRKRRVAVP